MVRFCSKLCNEIPLSMHRYYGIAFRFKLDFSVHVLKEIHVERIFLEKEKWDKDIVPKLTNFFLII